MTQFTKWADQSKVISKTFQSSNAGDLQKQINAFLATVDATAVDPMVIANITLAGAGDGFTFMCLVQVAPASAVSGGLFGAAAGTPGTVVRCFLAADGASFLAAKQAAGTPPAPGPTAPYISVDEQVAGSAKGTRFMGLTVFALSAAPTNALQPFLYASVGVGQILAVGPNVITLDQTGLQVNGFTLLPAAPPSTQARYNGAMEQLALFDLSITVKLDAPGTFTVAILRDPLGATTPIGGPTGGSVDVAAGSENVSVNAVSPLIPVATSATDSLYGVLVTSTQTGSIVPVSKLRIAPMG